MKQDSIMKHLPVLMSEVFKALGNPTRLRIIRMLASEMEKDLCVVDLAKKLGVTQPAASQHIKVLKNVGILEPKRNGNRVHYNLNPDVLVDYKNKIDGLFELAFKKCQYYDTCKGHNE